MTDDFFRSRIDQMIDYRHPLVVLASCLPWQALQAGVAPQFAHKERPHQQSEETTDLAGPVVNTRFEFCRADYIFTMNRPLILAAPAFINSSQSVAIQCETIASPKNFL